MYEEKTDIKMVEDYIVLFNHKKIIVFLFITIVLLLLASQSREG